MAPQNFRRAKQRGIPNDVWARAKSAAALSEMGIDEWVAQALRYSVTGQISGDFDPKQVAIDAEEEE